MDLPMDLPMQRRKFEESEEVKRAVRGGGVAWLCVRLELLDLNVDLERV